MRALILSLLLFPVAYLVNAQTKAKVQESFEDGIYFFVRGDYSEAAYNFRLVVEKYPENAHYNFKLGECYMNIPGSESLAVPCFEKAVRHTTTKNKYRDKDFEEDYAPLHAWFYLGNVYRVTGKLEEALNAYNTFTNSPYYYGNYNTNVVDNEVKSCERAKIIMDSPINCSIKALDTTINTTAPELQPAVSANEQVLVFIRKLKFYDALFMSTKQGDSWSQAVNISPLVGSDGDLYPVSLSADGTQLYIVKNDPINKDLYVSYWRNSTWTKAVPLNKYINSEADETWASISSDGKTLWFTSSRKGGIGGLDIYYSSLDDKQQWGKAHNAGDVINTQFDEESPCLIDNDKILFSSSKGHYSMGGYDIFYTVLQGKNWKEPVNIGFPISNTADEKGYCPVEKGKSGYFARIGSQENDSTEDIFRVTLVANYPLP
jgi:tetratricopeptide (TPR) repeat protein